MEEVTFKLPGRCRTSDTLLNLTDFSVDTKMDKILH